MSVRTHAQAPADTTLRAARGLVERVVPDSADRFELETIQSVDGRDVFEVEGAAGGKVVLRGSNGVAIASALDWYLENRCHADLSWNGRHLDVPVPLPPVGAKVRKVTPHRYRYFFNYCCFGYSLPWWDWSQWETMIDWMAMKGINMPLAVTGQEAVWQNVLREFGLDDDAIRGFFAGPPYLPFGWMGCLDGWGGPLPRSWIDRHADLERKILARERELGMTPVLQGFTGHVPPAVREKFPDAKLHTIRWIEWRTSFIDPVDPLFRKFGKAFVDAQTRLYGTDHLYAADTFIEMTPPSSDPAFLDAMGKTLSETLTASDPEAVWVMQGWIFFNNARFWKPPQARAFLGGVPDDRMILLDLYCDRAPVWNKTEAFHGKPWIWCVLQNFGNTVQLNGPLARINRDLHAARADPRATKLSGIGMIQEGLDYNPVVFDFMTEMTWRTEPVDLDAWLRDYAHRRCGRKLPAAEKAWKILERTVYDSGRGGGSVVTARPGTGGRSPGYDSAQLWKAWELLLSCSDDAGSVDAYRFDLVNVSRQALVDFAGVLQAVAMTAWAEKDAAKLATTSREFLGLVRDIDDLLATREEFLLGRWLEDAKRWGANDGESRRLEWNARNVITLWGGRNSHLHDYARREWSGLIDGFYLKRWELWFERLEQSLKDDRPFDSAAFTRDVRAFEERWTHQRELYPTAPRGDSVALSRKLFAKYGKNGEHGLDRLKVRHLAVGKRARASSVHGSQAANKAVDGIVYDRDSGWWADPWPQRLEVDLGAVRKIGGVHLWLYWDGSRYYRYTVSVSRDGKAWTEVVDRRKNKSIAKSSGDRVTFTAVDARYVRLDMLENSANTGVHVAEMAVLEAQP